MPPRLEGIAATLGFEPTDLYHHMHPQKEHSP
jgi:hypothetical protein